MADIILPQPDRPHVLITAADEADVLGVDPNAIMALYREHGALLFRGFPTDLAAFARFTDQFCVSSVFNESPDRRLLEDAANIQSVNGGADPFPLHPELSREPWKPDTCFFCCLEPPREQGATTICDGIALAAALPPVLRQALDGRRLLYIRPASPEALKFWLGTAMPSDAQLTKPPVGCPYIFRRMPGGGILLIFSRPALHRPMFDDRKAFGNFLLFARYYLGLAGFPLLDTGEAVPDAWLQVIKDAGDRLSAPVQWRRGDLLMLDNTRFMHGRTAIIDVDDRLIASYFGYLRDAIPDADEPAAAPWRMSAFRPPIGRIGAPG